MNCSNYMKLALHEALIYGNDDNDNDNDNDNDDNDNDNDNDNGNYDNECNTSSHLYQPYGYVIICDLSIIPNSKLRDLIAKGLKYREPCKVDWDKN